MALDDSEDPDESDDRAEDRGDERPPEAATDEDRSGERTAASDSDSDSDSGSDADSDSEFVFGTETADSRSGERAGAPPDGDPGRDSTAADRTTAGAAGDDDRAGDAGATDTTDVAGGTDTAGADATGPTDGGADRPLPAPTDDGDDATAATTTAGDPALQLAVFLAAMRPLWVVVVLVTLPFVAVEVVPPLSDVTIPLWAQYAPLVASAVLFGMPHGAVDHLVPARLGGASLGRSVGAVVAVYAVVGGGYLAAWFLAPVPAAVLFVAVTWAHWGQGDVYLLSAATGGDYPRSVPHRLLVLVVRGAMPMAVPLVAGADQYRRVIADLVGLFGADAAAVSTAFAPSTRLAVGAGVAVLALLSLARGAVDREDKTLDPGLGFRYDAVETVLLAALFLAVPPILAVGLYFSLWHSLRHVVRLLIVDEAGAEHLRSREFGAALARFGRDAAPLTVAALALVGAVYVLVPDPPTTVGEAVALYLVLIAALTLPHVVVVWWMDREQGVWSPPFADPRGS